MTNTTQISDPTATVKVIRRSGSNVLIEWYVGHDFRRGWLPKSALTFSADGRTAECPNPEEAAPYGVPWAAIAGVLELDSLDIERELHRFNIWTVDDLKQHPNQAASALLSVIGLEVTKLLERANAWEAGN